MKKLVLTILAIFYLGVSSEATVHIHYCMGKLIDWSIFPDEAGNCSNCGMEKGNSKDCCKDQQHTLAVKDSTKAFKIVYNFNTLAINIPLTTFIELEEVFVNFKKENKIVSNSPPRTQATPAFIRNCTFRI